jgi:large subunit ribosomal protein L29
MLKVVELRDLSKQELKEKLEDLKKSLFQMRTQGATGRIEKPGRIKQMRRDIARLLTVLKEKEK